MTGENTFAKCRYLGCSLIVHGMKCVLFLFLCGDGCVCNILGMGPGLVLMSPLRSRRCTKSFLFFGMVLFFL